MIIPAEYDRLKFPGGEIAVPATEWMYTKSVNALIGVLGWTPPGTMIEINQQAASIATNRNLLIERFLPDKSLEWLLFIDSDMIPEPITACRLPLP